jgi:hypothetical protein
MDDGTAQRAETRGPAHSHEVKRLNWGCGEFPGPGWINSDVKELPGIDISCDIRDGLPLDDESLDYAVSIHALPEIPYPDLVPALRELRRYVEERFSPRRMVHDYAKAYELAIARAHA